METDYLARRSLNLLTVSLITGALGFSGSGCGSEDVVDVEDTQDYVVTNAGELASLSGLTAVTGNLTIEQSVDLTSLEGLESLTKVQGSLRIRNNSTLENLKGLDNLAMVGKDLRIKENDVLVSVAACTSLTSVKNLYVEGNDALVNLDGFNNLLAIGGEFHIRDNDAMTSLEALSEVSSVNGNLWINQNDALEGLEGLRNLTTVNGALGINNNSTLTNLNGLRNLSSVEGVWIGYEIVTYPGGASYQYDGNDALVSVQGLSKLTSVGGTVHISTNINLTSLQGLHNIETIEENLIIHRGFFASLRGLDSLTTVGGMVHVFSNYNLAALELNKLESIGANYYILKNSNLPTALVTALRDQVFAGGGIGGDIVICENQGGSPCNN